MNIKNKILETIRTVFMYITLYAISFLFLIGCCYIVLALSIYATALFPTLNFIGRFSIFITLLVSIGTLLKNILFNIIDNITDFFMGKNHKGGKVKKPKPKKTNDKANKTA